MTFEILEKYGLPGVVIFALGFVIYKYLLPTILKVGETNAKQAESLVQVSNNIVKLAEIANDLPDQIENAKKEIITEIKSISNDSAH